MSLCNRVNVATPQPVSSAKSFGLTSLFPENEESMEMNSALIALSHQEKVEQLRKERLGDSLSSLRAGLNVCQETVGVEMLIAKEVAVVFGTRERKIALLMTVMGVFTLLFAGMGQINWLLVLNAFFYFGFSSWFFNAANDKKKVATDAVHALNLVSKSLTTLDIGITRCNTVLTEVELVEDLEWEKEEEANRKLWEEERKRSEELQLQRINSRLKKLHPEMSAIKREKELQRIQQLEQTRKRRSAFSRKDKSSKGQSATGSFRNIFSSGRAPKPDVDAATMAGLDPTVREPEFAVNSTKTWQEYVNVSLRLERLATMTEVERAFSKQLREKSNGKWDELPLDLKLMALRAWEGRKDRLEFTLEQVDYIVDWRHKCDAENMLNNISEPVEERFFDSWKTRFGGEDIYGHPVIFDRVDDFNLDYLFTLTDHQVLSCHTKQMEVLRRRKTDIGLGRHQRVCKHVYILDLKGLSLNKHFNTRVKNLLISIFKVEGTAYPDSLWSLWLINTPVVFKLIWGALSPGIDPASKAKIRMKGTSADYIPEMEKCGIPRSAIPRDLEGDFTSVTYWDTLKQIYDQDHGLVSKIQDQLNTTV
jgi:hypothetical protein